MNGFLNILKAVLAFFPRLFKAVFGSKKDRLKNKFLFKRGGYAVAVIALVIAGAIVLNLLVGALADRFDLEYDLTTDKKHSISEENKEYIKTVDKKVTIYVIASSPSEYYGGYMEYYANQMSYSASTSDYYAQTTRFLELYAELNDNISVVYMDPYGTQMAEIVSKYPESFNYGDILVTSTFTTKEGVTLDNYRLLTIADIYTVEDTSGMAAYGYDYYYITGSSLETSLTSAVASVISEETKKVAFIASHSKAAAFDYYRGVLKLNNFIVEDINEDILHTIPNEYDAVIICAPQKDFTKDELSALSEFLDNGGKLGKTLIFYGDTGYQNLPNFYNFLGEWGIAAESGIVMESNPEAHLPKDHATYISYGQTSSPVKVSEAYMSGYNIPMYENGQTYAGRTAQTIIGTNGTSVIVPITTDASKELPESLEKRKLSGAIISTEEDFDNEAKKSIFSRVIAFSSIDFISKEYVERYATVDYTGTSLNALRFATGMNEVELIFENKTIDATKELYVISSASATAVRWIFIGVIPVAVLVLAFVIFFKRRNK
ncbi:MAG: GldG family protein [Clostridia bacterium]|nr:GldG family protein [Clostridia bacterium]